MKECGMSGWGAPEVTIPLRDGTVLRVGPEGVHVGDQVFSLRALHDARLVSPAPETIALRLADERLVECQPARPGDAAVALEAIYRLRPDLRPAGFAPLHSLPPTFPPPQPPPVAPPGFYPSPAASPPGYAPYFAPNPNALQPELTPIPRTFGQLLGAVFQLYFKHWTRWLALGLCVGIWPGLLVGVALVVSLALLGLDPSGGYLALISSPSSSVTTPALNPLQGQDQLVLVGLLAGSLGLLLFFVPWQAATLGVAARAAVLGRPVKISAALSGGLRRLLPVLGVYVLEALLFGVVFGVVAGVGVLLGFVLGSTLVGSREDALLSLVLWLLALELLMYVGIVYLGVRLALAPYAAATQRIGPARALGTSWRLTRGNFWRTLGVLFIVGLVVNTLSNAVSVVQLVSIPAAFLVLLPLVLGLTVPLSTLAAVVVLYDLRLRREGYQAVAVDERSGAENQGGGALPLS
jgi:hypothetical protein